MLVKTLKLIQSPNTLIGNLFVFIMQNFITAPNVLDSKKVESR
jgi:hypothetical protein